MPYDLDSLAKRLKTVSHLRDLSDADCQAIVAAGVIRRFPAGATIFVEGEPTVGMFVLMAGRVHLCKLGPQGQESIIATIKPVIMFNEVTVLDGGPNLATAVTVEECITWNIRYDDFQALMRRFPQLGLGLLRVLAARYRHLLTQYEDLSFRPVLARAARLLLDLSDGGKTPIDRRQHSNREMAARVATVQEAFSRSLQLLKTNGYIDSTRTIISVRSPDALAQIAEIGPALRRG